ncbi:MAG: DUF5320 domain-containing protein [Phycisphaerae bacterium]
MPFGDGTGPSGMGPMTGRAAGFCAGYNRPGYAAPYGGRGFGGGRGRGGRGWRNRFFATGLFGWQRGAAQPPAAEADQQLDTLRDQAEYFENALNDIRRRIDDMESSGGSD